MSNKRSAKMGTYTVVLALIVLAAIIIINMIVCALPSKYTIIDTSAEKLYSISEQTEQSIKRINEDVVINYLCQNGTQDEMLRAFLDRYATANPKIKIKIVDPIESPAFTLKYTDGELSNYSLIIESASNFKIIDYLDIYALDLYAYYYQGIQQYTFNGERLITSALDFVTSGNTPTIYTLNGHSEAALSETLKSQITSLNYLVSELKLVTVSAVPDDASAIIINAPKADLNDDDVTKLKAYLDKGGKIFLITSALVKTPYENLMKVTGYYGLSMSANVIIEENTDKCVSGMPYWLLPDTASHAITDPLKDSKFIQIPYAHPINTISDVRSSVSITNLFTTSDKAYTIDPSATEIKKTESSITGKFTVGAVAQEKNKGTLVWIGSDYTFVDQANSYSSGSNYQYFISVIKTLSPRDTIVSEIPGITIAEPTLTVSEAQATFWGTILTAIIPLAFVAYGLAKWIIRRRK